LGNDNNVNNCNPVVICKPAVIYATDKQKARIKELEEEVEKLKRENQELRAIFQIEDDFIHNPYPAMRRRNEDKNNAISLIGAASQTGMDVTNNGDGSFSAHSVYRPDAGLMYQHDFNNVRGSIGATLNGSALLGVGLKF
jgi:hypothetical protein